MSDQWADTTICLEVRYIYTFVLFHGLPHIAVYAMINYGRARTKLVDLIKQTQ